MEPDAPEPAVTPTEYVVQSGDVLSRIAAKFGVTTAQLMDWNDLADSRISVGQKLMVGAPMESEEEEPAPTPEPAPEEEAPAPEPPTEETNTAEPEPEPEPADAGMIEYTVKSGDILSRIASDHDVTVQQLMDWNDLENSRLSIGQKLMIGGSAESAPEAAPAETEPEEVEPEPAPAEAEEMAPETANPEPAAPENMTEYVVQSGDVLSRIATKFGVTAREIMDWNGLDNTRIRIGQTLKIASGDAAEMAVPEEAAEPEPEPEEAAEPESAEVTQTKHSVQIGETLSGIASQYGVSMADLISWNDLDPDGKLQAGRVLTIYGGSSGSEPEPAPEAAEEEEDAFGEYVIQSGDSPLSIAQQFGISPEELMDMNGVTDVNTLRVGQTLRVPKSDE
jgi:LysM repeat protein